MAVITIDHVTKSFGKVEVLKEFTSEFADGEFITLLGPSGCGKTTMLRMLAGFERPTSGSIMINGKTMSSDKEFVPPEKRGIGMVFQSYAVWPHMNVFKNVAYPLKIRKLAKEEIKEKVDRILEVVHLTQYATRMPSELSGGQQQRVALARALVAEPEVLLLDEPLSNLDAKLREEMRFEIKEIQKRLGINVVYVTHDQAEAMTMSDRVFVLNAGVVQQVGTPEEIYRHPVNSFVANFVGKVAFLKGNAAGGFVSVSGTDEKLRYDGPVSGKAEIAIRPESIKILLGKDTPNSISAVVTAQYFMGENTDIRVTVGGSELRINAPALMYNSFKPGDTVKISIGDFMVFADEGEAARDILT
ncbi:MAG: ABC transporter ATP-binding protein [Lachnospiraceae bacterium]|nr:ABC transporter ATP-binding protein [Lachnospiraceae bacterium]